MMGFSRSVMIVMLFGLLWNTVLVDGSVCFTHGYHWSSWQGCSATCGGGFRVRHCYADGTQDTQRCSTWCRNGAVFVNEHCNCPPGTQGRCCDDILECNSNPCKNGGHCNEQINGFTCTCPFGTTGPYCDDILECNSNPCQNNGTCNEHVGYYTCDCVYGTTGPNCVDIPDCASTPCQHGGTCEEHVGDFTCHCPPGTTNKTCDDIPECISNPCQHGGTCNEMVNMYNCTCKPGYTGYNCEMDLFWEHDSICHKEGSCYMVFKIPLSWNDAKAFCLARQGHLFVPNDLNEELYMENYLRQMRDRYSEELFWIGGTKSYTNSPAWIEGSHISVYRWPAGVPDDIPGTQCLVMDGQYNFEWQTRPCTRNTFYICEEQVPFQIVG